MHRAISNYKITKRKDGRYYVRLQDGGEITHIYGKTKAEVQAKLEIRIEELNALDRRRIEQSFPTRNITLANWAHLCLNTFCASTISGNTYVGYQRYIRLHFGKLADTPISKITNFMVQEHINSLSRLGGKEGMSEAFICLKPITQFRSTSKSHSPLRRQTNSPESESTASKIVYANRTAPSFCSLVQRR